jgi:Primase C terminal 2 (PriCT-2)
VKLSIHKIIRGKPVKCQDATGRPYYEHNAQRVNLGWGWENIEADWPTVFELITQDGVATSAELTTENRKEDNFVSRDLVMVDIDSGMTIPELLEDAFYNRYAAGFYVTPSHTWEAHRFRVMFRLATPLTVASDVVKLNKMLMRIFTQADAACKDATRIFYGTPGCVACERQDTVLSDHNVAQLIDQYNVWEATEMARHTEVEHKPLNDQQRERILQLLKSTFVGEYGKWRDIGWGLKAGGFSVADWQYVTTGMMSQKTPEQARQVWQDGRPNGRITMGTVIWFLRQRHGADCLRTDTPDRYAQYQAELAELELLEQLIQARKQQNG